MKTKNQKSNDSFKRQNRKDNQFEKKLLKKWKGRLELVYINIFSNFNNTLMNITNSIGEVVFWSSGGTVGMRGTRKSSPFTAKLITNEIIVVLKLLSIVKVHVKIKGIGRNRLIPINLMNSVGIIIESIRDVNVVAFNGTRPKKIRRV